MNEKNTDELEKVENSQKLLENEEGGTHKVVVYTVMHYMGIDGDHFETTFSKEEDARKLCALYNASSESSDYDFFWYQEQIVDEYSIEDFELVEYKFSKDKNGNNQKVLLNTKEQSPEEYLAYQRELYDL